MCHRTELLAKKSIDTLPKYEGLASHVDESYTYYVDEKLDSTPIAPLALLDSSASVTLLNTILAKVLDFFRFLVLHGLKIPGTLKEAVKLFINNLAFITDTDELVYMQVFKLVACKKAGEQMLLYPHIFKRILLREKIKGEQSISCGADCIIKSLVRYTVKYPEELLHTFCQPENRCSTILNALSILLPEKIDVIRDIQNVTGQFNHSFDAASTTSGTGHGIGVFAIEHNE